MSNQLEALREKHELDLTAHETFIGSLRKELEQARDDSKRELDDYQRIDALEREVKEKQQVLDLARENETRLKEKVEQLSQRLTTLETQLTEVSCQ